MSRKRFHSDAERQTERRVRYQMQGLTTQGKPRRRHANFVNHADVAEYRATQMREAREHKLAMKLAHYRRLAAQNKAKGLRVDGLPFRRQKTLAQAWREFRASVVIPE